jgi:hypothetical protein
VDEIGRVTPLLLAVLRALGGPRTQRHGFAIAKNAGSRPSSVYPVLDRLERAGWITAEWVPSPFEGRPPRRVYSLSEHGEGRADALLDARGAQLPPGRPDRRYEPGGVALPGRLQPGEA